MIVSAKWININVLIDLSLVVAKHVIYDDDLSNMSANWINKKWNVNDVSVYSTVSVKNNYIIFYIC